MAKITKDFVDRVKPVADFKTYWDEKDKGYGLRVSPLGKKVFVVMGRVKGLGKAICITIGPASMPEHQARKAAQTILYDKFRHGIDPRAEAKAALAEKVEESVALTTLSQVLDAYLSRPGKLKDSTKAEMRRHVEKVFTAWRDKPIASITEDDCRTRAPLERVAKAVGMDALSAHDLRRTMVSVGFASCGIDLFKLELLTNHVPKGITAKHYLRTSRLQYLNPDIQTISDWIEREGKVAAAKASGANVVSLRATA